MNESKRRTFEDQRQDEEGEGWSHSYWIVQICRRDKH